MPRPPLLVLIVLAFAVIASPLALTERGTGQGQSQLRIVGKGKGNGHTHGGDRIPRGSDRALLRQLAKFRRARAKKGRAAAVGNQLVNGAWCGIERATDDVANQSQSGPRVKVIYAYPAGSPNRFATMRDHLQADAYNMADILLSVPGSARTLRFDTGTTCGAGYLDIISVQLPRTSAQYISMPPGARMDQLETDLSPSVVGIPGIENYLVYADATAGNDYVAGIASLPIDESPGASNNANFGGLWAMVFGDAASPTLAYDRLTTALHEVSHNLGAVQDGAPNSTRAGHCTDERDVMCYADGGPANVMTTPCATQAYDCGRDDYFNPTPASGSYLATHWNVYNSAFMCAVGTCVGAGTPSTNVAPSARIVMRDAAGQAITEAAPGAVFKLDGSESVDDDGIVSYAWDVGDNGTVEGFTVSIPTSFPAVGTYPIRLTVKDAYGVTATEVATIRIAVPAPAPVADDEDDEGDDARDDEVQAIKATLTATLTSLRSGLRRAAENGRVQFRFSAPSAGRLESTVKVRGKVLLRRKATVDAGAQTVAYRLSAAARRDLRRGGAGVLTVRFVSEDGDVTTVTTKVTVKRSSTRAR